MLDWPTKVGLAVQKTSDSASLLYVVEALYTRMWRMGLKDPYSSNALIDVIGEIIWAKTCTALVLRNYPEVFSTRCNSDDAELNADESVASIKTAKSYLDSPLKFSSERRGLTRTRPGCRPCRARRCAER